MIAPNCHINSGNHGFKLINKSIMDQEYTWGGEFFIGKGSWLGRSVTILGGVKRHIQQLVLEQLSQKSFKQK